jgi:hypothetical protein
MGWTTDPIENFPCEPHFALTPFHTENTEDTEKNNNIYEQPS